MKWKCDLSKWGKYGEQQKREALEKDHLEEIERNLNQPERLSEETSKEDAIV
jgi:hypothetical protein